MVKYFCVLFFSLCISNAIARPSLIHEKKELLHGALAHEIGKGERIVTEPVILHTTPPRPIGESDKKKQCPVGFEFSGKQCAKTLTAPPDVVCPTGTTMVDGKCAKYVGKYAECPAGFEASKGTCVKETTSEPEIICPEGFVLSGKDTCSRKIPQPNKALCPAGSIPRGDDCIVTTMVPPQFTCPEQYILLGNKCRREETYDCTPERPIPPHHKGTEIESKSHPIERPTHGKETHRYTLPQAAPVVEEYVISETCKRVTTEPARKICPPGSILDGKLCRIEKKVDHIVKPGGFLDEFIPIQRRCPIGFLPTDRPDVCKSSQEEPPILQCPGNTIDLGSRCGIFSNPRTICPKGFSLEGKSCVKVTFAAPIVEYTVTYECIGKNCENNGAHAQDSLLLRH